MKMTTSKLAVVAVAALLVSGCSNSKPDCTSFGKEFDRLQAATAASAALIANRGVCHTQVEAERQAQCPDYYKWLQAAKTFSGFVAIEKKGCVSDADRAQARADFADLQKPDAFPVK